MIIPNIWKNKQYSKPPTSSDMCHVQNMISCGLGSSISTTGSLYFCNYDSPVVAWPSPSMVLWSSFWHICNDTRISYVHTHNRLLFYLILLTQRGVCFLGTPQRQRQTNHLWTYWKQSETDVYPAGLILDVFSWWNPTWCSLKSHFLLMKLQFCKAKWAVRSAKIRLLPGPLQALAQPRLKMRI